MASLKCKMERRDYLSALINMKMMKHCCFCLHLRLASEEEECGCCFDEDDCCTHLLMAVGTCPSCSGDSDEQQEKQRSSSCEEAINKKKKKRKEKKKKTAPSSWGYSTELMMYDDPLKMKKILNGSDVDNMSRMLLPKDMTEKLVVEVVGYNNHNDEEGVKVDICDVDTHSMHTLIFKRWSSSRSYVFTGNWLKDFVSRRSLKSGNEVGFHRDPYARRFQFSNLVRKMN